MGWVCPNCEEIEEHLSAFHGDDNEYHCPHMDCDEVLDWVDDVTHYFDATHGIWKLRPVSRSSWKEKELTPQQKAVVVFLRDHPKQAFSPSQISTRTGVRRERVYLDLQRLLKRDYVAKWQKATERPRWRAGPNAS